MTTLSVVFSEEEYGDLMRWKTRYAESVGLDNDRVKWGQLLLAYANSKVLP